MSYTMKRFEDLDLIDDFLMNVVAADEEVGREFSRTLLEGLLQREIGHVQISIQKVMFPNTPNHRGIRLDIEINEYEETDVEGIPIIRNIFDIEPNKKKSVNLPKHNRFYQAKIDSLNMKSGENDFVILPNLYVLTITDYDPFGHDYMMYTVYNQCEEVPQIEYGDGLKFIYFNTRGTKGGNSKIKSLLNFIQNSKMNNVTDEVTRKLHDCISRVKVSPELRMEYMKWDAMLFYERCDARNEGKIEGKIEGRIEGRIETLLESLEELGTVPENLQKNISEEKDLDVIKKWQKLVMKVDSIESFVEQM